MKSTHRGKTRMANARKMYPHRGRLAIGRFVLWRKTASDATLMDSCKAP
jgi:hypothetical protein